MRQRRFIPSTRLMLAFDAVMRQGSVTAAAEELNLTQSAVSRLILSLEEQLGKELFTRIRRRLVPNDTAHTYHQEVSRALDLVERASMRVVANPQGGTLSLAVLPTFATRWLGPRLGDFMGNHPGVAINMSTRIGWFDFTTQPFDAAIYFGNGDWVGGQQIKLFDERLTACASPDFAAQNALAKPEDLANLPLLHLEARPTAWDDWFAAQGADSVTARTGMLVDQFSMMIQAAISGLGVAILPDYLAQIDIEAGRLVPVLKQAVPMQGAYWLVWPEGRDISAPLASFTDWLAEQSSGLEDHSPS